MKKIKTILFIIVLSTFFMVDNTVLASLWIENINPWLVWSENSLEITIQNYINILLWVLYIVTILYWIYWWFKIFTAWDDDDKVKEWRKIIIQAILGVVIIFTAWPIVELILWSWTEEWILNN